MSYFKTPASNPSWIHSSYCKNHSQTPGGPLRPPDRSSSPGVLARDPLGPGRGPPPRTAAAPPGPSPDTDRPPPLRPPAPGRGTATESLGGFPPASAAPPGAAPSARPPPAKDPGAQVPRHGRRAGRRASVTGSVGSAVSAPGAPTAPGFTHRHWQAPPPAPGLRAGSGAVASRVSPGARSRKRRPRAPPPPHRPRPPGPWARTLDPDTPQPGVGTLRGSGFVPGLARHRPRPEPEGHVPQLHGARLRGLGTGGRASGSYEGTRRTDGPRDDETRDDDNENPSRRGVLRLLGLSMCHPCHSRRPDPVLPIPPSLALGPTDDGPFRRRGPTTSRPPVTNLVRPPTGPSPGSEPDRSTSSRIPLVTGEDQGKVLTCLPILTLGLSVVTAPHTRTPWFVGVLGPFPNYRRKVPCRGGGS